MSGGYYNYLGGKEIDEWHGAVLEEAEHAAAALNQQDYSRAAARELKALILALRSSQLELGERAKRLAPVLHALEWWKSGDWGEEHLRTACAELSLPAEPEILSLLRTLERRSRPITVGDAVVFRGAPAVVVPLPDFMASAGVPAGAIAIRVEGEDWARTVSPQEVAHR